MEPSRMVSRLMAVDSGAGYNCTTPVAHSVLPHHGSNITSESATISEQR